MSTTISKAVMDNKMTIKIDDKKTIKSDEILYVIEECGEATIKSCGRHYNECNVSDFVSILIANGYEVLISRPSEDCYNVKYYKSDNYT